MRRRMQAVRRGAALLALAVCLAVCLAGPAAADEPVWVWPVDGPRAVDRPFEPPATRYGPGHRGADLPARVGAAVHAAGAGRISYAGLLAGRGVVVVVHGSLRTTYEPVTASVRVGQQVAAGQVIGRLTAGHCPTGCLHWGLLRGEVYLDPVQLIHRGPSRLLPVDPGSAPAGALPPAARGPLPSPTPLPAGEPRLAMRSADRALGTGALVALLAGLALLVRPRRPPDGPAAPAASAAAPGQAPAPAPVAPAPTGLVDLAAERHRRRPEVA